MSTCATSGWISGTTWIALQPVPITATRLSFSSTSCRHSAVWNFGPPKLSSPGMWGTLGTESWPQAVTRMSASCVPALVSSTHLSRASFQVARFTSVPVRIRSSTPWLRATSSR